MDAPAVPFNVTRQGGDVFVSVETKGILRMDGESLVVEFVDTSTDYRSAGMASEKSSLRETSIPLRDLDTVAYGRRTLRASMLEVRCSRMAALADVPFADGNRFTVRIARAARDRAREFAASVEIAIADRRLRALDDGEP